MCNDVNQQQYLKNCLKEYYFFIILIIFISLNFLS